MKAVKLCLPHMLMQRDIFINTGIFCKQFKNDIGFMIQKVLTKLSKVINYAESCIFL